MKEDYYTKICSCSRRKCESGWNGSFSWGTLGGDCPIQEEKTEEQRQAESAALKKRMRESKPECSLCKDGRLDIKTKNGEFAGIEMLYSVYKCDTCHEEFIDFDLDDPFERAYAIRDGKFDEDAIVLF